MGSEGSGGKTVAVTLISAGLAAILAPVLAWIVNPAVLGQFNVLQLACSLGALVLSMGLDQSFVRNFFFAGDRRRLLLRCLLPGLGLSVFVTAIAILLTVARGEESPVSPWLMTLGAGTMVLTVLLRFSTVSSRMSLDHRSFLATQIVPKSTLLIACLAVSLNGIEVSIYFMLLGLFMGSLFAVLASARALRSLGRTEGEVPSTRSLFRFGTPLAISAIAYWGIQSFPPFLLSLNRGWEAAGEYAVLVSFAAPATVLQVALGAVWGPIAYRWLEAGTGLHNVRLAVTHLTRLSFLFVLFLASFSWIALPFLPDRYDDLIYLLPAAMVPSILYALSEVYGFGLGAAKRSGMSLFSSLIALLLGLGVGVVAIPQLGLTGGVLASVAANSVLLAGRSVASYRVWGSVVAAVDVLLVSFVLLLAISAALFGARAGMTQFVLSGGALVLFAFLKRRQLGSSARWVRGVLT